MPLPRPEWLETAALHRVLLEEFITIGEDPVDVVLECQATYSAEDTDASPDEVNIDWFKVVFAWRNGDPGFRHKSLTFTPDQCEALDTILQFHGNVADKLHDRVADVWDAPLFEVHHEEEA